MGAGLGCRVARTRRGPLPAQAPTLDKQLELLAGHGQTFPRDPRVLRAHLPTDEAAAQPNRRHPTWAFLTVFVGFGVLWNYYRIRLRRS